MRATTLITTLVLSGGIFAAGAALVPAIAQTAPAIYPFPVVENVKRVDLVVLSLNPSPRLEIREVAFNWSDVVATEGSSWSQVKVLFR